MWIKRARIENIRSIERLEWEVPDDRLAGWHVLLGDNGSGKSSFLRAIALADLGSDKATALRLDLRTYLRQGTAAGSVQVDVSLPDGGAGRAFATGDLALCYDGAGVFHERSISGFAREVFTERFSAGFGPFRRFAGGDKDLEKLFQFKPAVARYLSLFGEDVALTECLAWLQQLKFEKLENGGEGLLDAVVRFVNDADLLPHGVRIHDVTSKGVTFVDGNGCVVPVEELSDGFRSILSLTFEMLRQLALCSPAAPLFDAQDPTTVQAPGFVLIDEVDAHLHPTWQRRIGLWFRRHFPNVQFIVTTHSPLVCQAADVGTVFRLPTPGTDERGRMVTGIELDRLVYGNVLDAYGTDLFGADVTRSDESRRRLQRLAQLNQKERHAGLTEGEREEQQRLRATMPTAAHVSPPLRLDKVA